MDLKLVLYEHKKTERSLVFPSEVLRIAWQKHCLDFRLESGDRLQTDHSKGLDFFLIKSLQFPRIFKIRFWNVVDLASVQTPGAKRCCTQVLLLCFVFECSRIIYCSNSCPGRQHGGKLRLHKLPRCNDPQICFKIKCPFKCISDKQLAAIRFFTTLYQYSGHDGTLDWLILIRQINISLLSIQGRR